MTQRMNRKTKIILSAVASAVLLTGCGGEPDPRTGDPSGMVERHIRLEDGREIVCVTWKAGYAGGLSCDWSAR